ncbi:uncharacterized protein LOC125764432 [Anopheles funestus]|uniref:uncharacterized protein LOC125764432 n=1 Tax=Anopheles funestus TaxID=62324 RepID=UPI0020C5BCA8|nr:uncharacterized protein LOC125764432 [Anopheles funestus]XP_049284625.1 uncharacterized protein LOC125764432 [Anopheles funestus]
MEDNTISMFMDVKLDIRERKLEFSHMKSWSRYFVRVEAVKCFPCYMRISFFTAPTDLTTDLIVRINIPGLTVQMATSRTKQHSYGLFWKNNRKRCCAYFALETQLLCERHLRWMKKSIRNLELYRQEMMQLRRASRTPLYEIRQEMQPLDPLAVAATADGGMCDDMGIYQNLDNTQNIMGLQDILGPLPTVPVVERTEPNSANWSRRVSGMSGIYEEIRDDLAAPNSRLSRASIASGIYEEMKLVIASGEAIKEEVVTPPPPLPPRTRSNTNEGFDLQRSYTAPEAELMKKKRHHWLRLESMFGRRRTTSTNSQGSGSDKKNRKECKIGTRKTATVGCSESEKAGAVIHRDKVCRLRLAENKRNSFSSPDLSRLKISETPEGALCDDGVGNTSCDNLSDGVGSCTSEFYLQRDIDYIEEDCCFASSEFINTSGMSLVEESEPNVEQYPEGFGLVVPDLRRLNISERILDGFNRSANSSTVNLVGCVAAIGEENYEIENGSTQASATVACPPPIKEADLDGYLEMGPVGTGFNRQKLLEEVVMYRNNPLPPIAAKRLESSVPDGEESIYMSMGGTEKVLQEPIRSSSTSSSSSSTNSSSGVSSASEHSYAASHDGTGKHRCSVDDKIPSYYPNEDSQRTSPSSKRKGTIEDNPMTPPATTLPRMVRSAQRAESTVEQHDRIQASFRTPKASSRRLRTLHGARLSPKDAAHHVESAAGSGSECSPKLYQKYATLARLSSSPCKTAEKSKNPLDDKVPEKGIVTTPVTTPISKRFGSLPRFGKIDLSPLRMKINSVLQRHNSGNL